MSLVARFSLMFGVCWCCFLLGWFVDVAVGFNDDPQQLWIYESVPPPLDTSRAIVQYGSSTKYTKSDQSSNDMWKSLTFDDSSWTACPLPYGYDDGNAFVNALFKTREVSQNSFHRFRFSLSSDMLSRVKIFGAILDVASDNAADVFVNGVQMIDSTPALMADPSGQEFEYANDRAVLATDLLKDENIIAIKLLNNEGSSDAFLDFRVSLNVEVLKPRAQWRYANSTPSQNWVDNNFDDSSFMQVQLPIGFDDRVQDKFFTVEERAARVYFRKSIDISPKDAMLFSAYTFKLIFDAKAALWIDGKKQFDSLMMPNQNATYFNRIINVTLTEGTHVIAALIESSGRSSMFFDCTVDGIIAPPPTTTTLTTVTTTMAPSSSTSQTLVTVGNKTTPSSLLLSSSSSSAAHFLTTTDSTTTTANKLPNPSTIESRLATNNKASVIDSKLIGGSIGGAVAVIALIVCIVFIVRRRRRDKQRVTIDSSKKMKNVTTNANSTEMQSARYDGDGIAGSRQYASIDAFTAHTFTSHYSNPPDIKQQSPPAHYSDVTAFADSTASKSANHYANISDIKQQSWDAHYDDASAFVKSFDQLTGRE